jgi:formylglycine-generating enzyme required for sulfatase activity
LLILATEETFAAEKTYTNSIGMEFILVPSGSFMMGSDKSREENSPDTDGRYDIRGFRLALSPE